MLVAAWAWGHSRRWPVPRWRTSAVPARSPSPSNRIGGTDVRGSKALLKQPVTHGFPLFSRKAAVLIQIELDLHLFSPPRLAAMTVGQLLPSRRTLRIAQRPVRIESINEMLWDVRTPIASTARAVHATAE